MKGIIRKSFEIDSKFWERVMEQLGPAYSNWDRRIELKRNIYFLIQADY